MWDGNNLWCILPDRPSANFNTAKVLAETYFLFLTKPVNYSSEKISECPQMPVLLCGWIPNELLWYLWMPVPTLERTAGVHNSWVTTTITATHTLSHLPFTPHLDRLTSVPLKLLCPLPPRMAPFLVAWQQKCSLVQEIMCQDKRRNVFFFKSNGPSGFSHYTFISCYSAPKH